MGRAPLLLLLLSLVASGYRNVREGETVLEMAVVGNERLTDEQVLSGLRTRVGRPLVATDVTADVRDLYSRYGVRVTVVQDVRAGGVALTLRVDEEALVQGVEVRGVDSGRGRELLDEIGLTGARALLLAQVRSRADELVARLREEGHAFAAVEVGIEDRDGRPVAVLDVTEGPKVEVVDVEILGLETLDPSRLESVLQTRPTRFIVLKSYLRRDVLERDLVEAERWLGAEGYTDARVALEEIRYSDDREEATIVLRVDQGPRYTIGEVRVDGAVETPLDALRAEVEMAAGDPLRVPDLERDRRRMLDLLGARGFVRATVTTRVQYAEQGTTVSVTHAVEEGERKRVRDVLVRGNTGTRDEVVRREVTLSPGDVASTDELARTNERLRKLGYFVDDQGRNRVSTRFRPTEDPALEDLFVEVDESRSGRFYFTAGGMTDIGFFAGVRFEKRNFDWRDSPSAWDPITLFSELVRNEAFHGGGQELIVQVLPGNQVSNYLVSFTEPFLNGPEEFPLAWSLEAYLRTIQLEDEFQQDRLGLGTTFTDQLDERWRVGVLGRLELVDISDVDDDDAPDDVEDVEGTNFVPAVGVFARYDDFDSVLEPTEGKGGGGRVELLGVDAFGARSVVDGTWITPLHEDDEGRRGVLALRGALGAATGFGDDLPFFERHQGGGVTGDFPLRGFEYRGIGPKKVGVHTGGEFAWSGTAEYRFPLYSTYDPYVDAEIERLRGVVFLDVGAVEESFGDALSRPRMAIGTGVRVALPFLGPVPVAVDLGLPLLSESDDDTELLSIRVSTRF